MVLALLLPSTLPYDATSVAAIAAAIVVNGVGTGASVDAPAVVVAAAVAAIVVNGVGTGASVDVTA